MDQSASVVLRNDGVAAGLRQPKTADHHELLSQGSGRPVGDPQMSRLYEFNYDFYIMLMEYWNRPRSVGAVPLACPTRRSAASRPDRRSSSTIATFGLSPVSDRDDPASPPPPTTTDACHPPSTRAESCRPPRIRPRGGPAVRPGDEHDPGAGEVL
jgi:hypothetical protein